jgi:hypothetical protein
MASFAKVTEGHELRAVLQKNNIVFLGAVHSRIRRGRSKITGRVGGTHY